MTSIASQEILHKSNHVLKSISFFLLIQKTNMSSTSSPEYALSFSEEKEHEKKYFPRKEKGFSVE